MAYIAKRKGGRWLAQIKRVGVQSISRVFDSRKEASEWARKVEAGLDAATPRAQDDRATVADLVRRYRLIRLESGRPIGATSNEHYMLQHLDADLGDDRVVELTPRRMLEWASARHRQGAGPYTVLLELSKLGTVLRYVSSYESLVLPDVVGGCRPLLAGMQLTGPGCARARRVTEDELSRLIEYFADRPVMADAIRLSVAIGIRRGELFKLRSGDVIHEQKAVVIRKRKHPRQTLARDEVVPLLGDAWGIVSARAQQGDRLFPLQAGYASKLFKRACNALGIQGLRWHDLRHEASSRLRDMGFEAIERQAILGHATERMNARYTHVRVSDLHGKFERVTGRT